MLKKKRKLVKILSESTEQLWNSEQLAGLLHTSQRTVLRYIKELKEEEEKGGFQLCSQKGKEAKRDMERFPISPSRPCC